MANLHESKDFLSFCLERADELSRRDWLASLTLLTVRRRFSTSDPMFQLYSQRLLRDADTMFEESVHLLLHRFGVLLYAPAVWQLLPLVVARLPLMTPKQLSISAWSLGRTLVNGDEVWIALGDAFRRRVPDFQLRDLAMLAWSFAAVDRAMPAEVVALKQAVRKDLLGQGTDGVSSHDLCMLFRSVAKLTPQDRRFLEWLLLLMMEGIATKTMAFTAQGISSIWGTLALQRWKLSEEVREALCEEVRSLRLDHTFNQDMAVEIAEALVTLEIDDPRPDYQIADFVARKGLSLRADTLLALAEFLCVRGVTHEKAWKRIGVRAQQRAVDLQIPDIDRLIAVFKRAGKGNNRVFGMLNLFMLLREDSAKYGAS